MQSLHGKQSDLSAVPNTCFGPERQPFQRQAARLRLTALCMWTAIARPVQTNSSSIRCQSELPVMNLHFVQVNAGPIGFRVVFALQQHCIM